MEITILVTLTRIGRLKMSEKSLAKIVGDLGNMEDFKAADELLVLVNQKPPKNAVKDHPLQAGVKFMPIAVVETMLTKLFQYWNVEVLREGQLLNSIYVTVRLHYRHPLTKEMIFQDGVGAVQIQVDKGKNASDLGAIKSNAIMLALPSAKSFAIKDAAEHIGRVFGRDMNRKDTMAFTPSYSDNESNLKAVNSMIVVEQIKQLEDLVKECTGMNREDGANWFHEIIGLEYSQVRKFEFEAVKTKILDERVVFP